MFGAPAGTAGMTARRRLGAGLVRMLPGGLLKAFRPERRGRFEFIRGHHKHFYALGGPMNGQAHRLEIARSIIERCRIECIVETGTHRAATTAWLAEFELPVHTVELDPQFHAFAAMRLKEHRNVSLHRGHSVPFLRALAAGPAAAARVFIYLDAHWQDDLPLADEVRIILGGFRHAVVLIDDFEVPGDPGYRFDDYGPGKALTLGYLAPALTPACALFRPAAPSRWETGAKRGSIVLASDPEMASALRRLPCLAPLEMP